MTGFLAVEKSRSLHKPGIEVSNCDHVLETLSKPLRDIRITISIAITGARLTLYA